MDKYTETLILIDSDKLSKNNLVAIMELCIFKLEIDTPSELSRIETEKGNKISRNGILKSNRFKKIKIGKQTFAIKGVKNSSLPF